MGFGNLEGLLEEIKKSSLLVCWLEVVLLVLWYYLGIGSGVGGLGCLVGEGQGSSIGKDPCPALALIN